MLRRGLVLLAPAGGAVAACAAAAAAAAPTPASTWPPMAKSADGAVIRSASAGSAFGEVLGVTGTLNYQQPGVTRVEARRDAGGSDSPLVGAAWAPTQVLISSGRHRPGLTLDRAGFQLLTKGEHPGPETGAGETKGEHPGIGLGAGVSAGHRVRGEDLYCERAVIGAYYRECEEIVKQVTGGRLVAAFDHNVRCDAAKAKGKRIDGGNLVQGAASLVHGDYTATSAPRRLQALAEPPKRNDPLAPILDQAPLLPKEEVDRAISGGGRYAFVNVWRPIRTVETKPLACCDASTTSADDLIVFSIQYEDRVGENYFATHSDRHQWYYFPRMNPDEAMLIKQWDSDGVVGSGRPGAPSAPSAFALHSAFADPSSPASAPDRESIEVRCVVLY